MAIQVSSEPRRVIPPERHGPRPARSDLKAPGLDASAARRFLEVLNTPRVGCNELRVLRAAFDRQGRVAAAKSLEAASGAPRSPAGSTTASG